MFAIFRSSGRMYVTRGSSSMRFRYLSSAARRPFLRLDALGHVAVRAAEALEISRRTEIGNSVAFEVAVRAILVDPTDDDTRPTRLFLDAFAEERKNVVPVVRVDQLEG